MSYLHVRVSWCPSVTGGYLWQFATGKSHQKYFAFSLGKVETAYVHKIEIIFISAKYFELVHFYTLRFGKADIFLVWPVESTLVLVFSIF